jgi:hypothetical protein
MQLTIEDVSRIVMLSFVLPVNSMPFTKGFGYCLISLYSINYLLDNVLQTGKAAPILV